MTQTILLSYKKYNNKLIKWTLFQCFIHSIYKIKYLFSFRLIISVTSQQKNEISAYGKNCKDEEEFVTLLCILQEVHRLIINNKCITQRYDLLVFYFSIVLFQFIYCTFPEDCSTDIKICSKNLQNVKKCQVKYVIIWGYQKVP